jgi:hypothetical protein
VAQLGSCMHKEWCNEQEVRSLLLVLLQLAVMVCKQLTRSLSLTLSQKKLHRR